MDATLIIQVIQAILAAAPTIAEGVAKAKLFISALFGAGLITVNQQNALYAHVEALGYLASSGLSPDWWQVEPDPE